jgi:hypothetical protein
MFLGSPSALTADFVFYNKSSTWLGTLGPRGRVYQDDPEPPFVIGAS